LSKLLYDAGEDQQANEHLAWALQVAREINGKLLECVGSLIKAEVALIRDNNPQGMEALRIALTIAATGESTYPMWCDAATWTRLCAKALEANIQPAYVHKLIRIMRLLPEGPVRRCEVWPWPVRIRILGRFAVQVDDKPLPMTRKTPRRLLELLQAIVAFGGENVPISRIMDALWPEADGDAAYRALISALARLRKLLVHPDAIVFQEGRLGLSPTLVWVDAAAFDLLAQKSDRIAGAGAAQSEQVVEQGLSLYRGPFLADVPDAVWAERTREKFRSKYIRLVEAAIRSCQSQGNWNEAIAKAEQALQTEPLSEALYRLLMRTLQQSGRIDAAQSVYVRCCKALSQSGNGSPSQETVQLYKTLHFS
jgi:DNA-binding SARP family transcriptional activator